MRQPTDAKEPLVRKASGAHPAPRFPHPDIVRSHMADDRNDRDRLKAIEMAVGQIEKQFGKGSIMRLGKKDVIAQIPAISTGAVSLDYALGIGGGARGPAHEDFGAAAGGQGAPAAAGVWAGGKKGGR